MQPRLPCRSSAALSAVCVLFTCFHVRTLFRQASLDPHSRPRGMCRCCGQVFVNSQAFRLFNARLVPVGNRMLLKSLRSLVSIFRNLFSFKSYSPAQSGVGNRSQISSKRFSRGEKVKACLSEGKRRG